MSVPKRQLRLGLWGARGDRRGLAVQSGEFARHMRPVKVVGFDFRSIGGSPLPLDWSDFQDAELTVMNADDVTREIALDWMRDLDVIWACETWYQPDLFPAWAREAGVATVQHVNPEFYRYDAESDLPRPTIEIAPSSWRLSQMSCVANTLPCPVPLDRLPFRQRPLGQPVTFLHVAGAPAAQDRNGTEVVAEALTHVQRPCRLLVYRQGGNATLTHYMVGQVQVEYQVIDVPHYWTLYSEGDVLLMPRRYGGQSLPVQEAAACGIPAIMTDCSPQRDEGWPCIFVPSLGTRSMPTQAGVVAVMQPDPIALAAAMDKLAEPEVLAEQSRLARAWAETRSWETLRSKYEAVLERAVRLARGDARLACST